jgi:voltage-gated potassium channel
MRFRRLHLAAGLTLSVTAIGRMLREREKRGPLVLVISLLVVGTTFYSLVEGWSALDALYFSTLTLATVGFGDFVPETEAGKVFTILYVLVGIGLLVEFFSALAHETLALREERVRERRGREHPQSP